LPNCQKRSNTASSLSAGIPIPVSITDIEFIPNALAAHLPHASIGRELDRIGNEVSKDLKHPVVVESRGQGALANLRYKANSFLPRRGFETVYRLCNQLGNVADLWVYSELARVDANDIEQIAHHPIHSGDVALDSGHLGDCPVSLIGFGRLLR